LLAGEGVSPEVQASIHAIAAAERTVKRPNEILTMHFGPQDVLVALSLDFVDSGTASDVEKAVTRIERQIKAAHPEVKRVFVESQDRRCSSPQSASARGHAGGRNVDLRGQVARGATVARARHRRATPSRDPAPDDGQRTQDQDADHERDKRAVTAIVARQPVFRVGLIATIARIISDHGRADGGIERRRAGPAILGRISHDHPSHIRVRRGRPDSPTRSAAPSSRALELHYLHLSPEQSPAAMGWNPPAAANGPAAMTATMAATTAMAAKTGMR
jgi:hypothetical protein